MSELFRRQAVRDTALSGEVVLAKARQLLTVHAM
jgi:hypothetical protein